MSTHRFLLQYVDHGSSLRWDKKSSRDFLDLLIHKRTLIPYHISRSMGVSPFLFVLNRYLTSLEAMIKINFPIHTIPFLIFKLKTFRRAGLLKILTKYLVNMCRSIAFMTWFVGSVVLLQ